MEGVPDTRSPLERGRVVESLDFQITHTGEILSRDGV